MTVNKRETPRTDAHTKSWSSILNDDLRGSWVEADFARQLECELNAANAELYRYREEEAERDQRRELNAARSATGAIELLRKVLAAHERLHASGTHGLPLSLKNEIAAAIAATDSGSDK